MAHKTLIGGTSYDAKSGRTLIGGTGYDIKKGRTLIDGTGYDISFGTPLSQFAEGTIIKINESGSPVEFYIAKHNYESNLNGSGRTLVTRKEFCDLHTYRGLETYLNEEYLNVFDNFVKELIGQTSYKAIQYQGTATETAAIFLPAAQELKEKGSSYTVPPPEVDILPIATILLGEKEQWTRSKKYEGSQYLNYTVYSLTESGAWRACGVGVKNNYRPLFTLPDTSMIDNSFNLIS